MSGRAVLIAGPTASGKSARALAMARELGGVIVNADSMQVYSGLRILTARPSVDEEAQAPHRVYGSVAPDRRFSTGEWLRATGKVMAEEPGRPLIFVGGTGLYFDALSRGFADVPEVPAEIVAAAEAEVAGLDRAGRAALLAARDPEMAAQIQAADPQRVVRVLAVLMATGRSLARFKGEAQAGVLDGFAVERIVLSPDREVLRERIKRRFNGMFEQGAVEEVEALLALGLDASLPVMKAIGVNQIGAFLAGTLTREEAVDLAVIATQQYAKRQRTWFRNRMADWEWLDS